MYLLAYFNPSDFPMYFVPCPLRSIAFCLWLCIIFVFFMIMTRCHLVAGDRGNSSDEMERLYIHLKQASLSPIGDRKPSTKREFRASFVKRCKNHTINDKLHLIRTLNSTLKVLFLFSPHCFSFSISIQRCWQNNWLCTFLLCPSRRKQTYR